MSLIHGETVTVHRPAVERDELGEPSTTWADDVVADVVVAPGSAKELDESRPDGVEVAWTLCFAQDYGQSLRGCDVTVRGMRCRVIGDPQPYTAANTPTRWGLTVEVEAVDG